MAATLTDISGWFDRGVADGAHFMIVVCDTFDHDDYPVYVPSRWHKDKNVREVADEYRGKNMQQVMEVYNLNDPKDPQMAERRCFNYGGF